MKNSAQDSIAIIGAGPAGLMAAEVLIQAGMTVAVYDAMPSAGRKFLMAGKSGLNITHDEDFDAFVQHYAERQTHIKSLLARFSPDDLRAWVHGLGIETFTGSSGMVFPKEMKAAPLLRAWLHRLRQAGVIFHMRHRWLGWDDSGALCLQTPQEIITLKPAATVLALGGGSWQRLGSDAKWIPLLQQHAIDIAPLKPANCGFDVNWSEYLRNHYAGQPVKSVTLSFTEHNGVTRRQQGDFVVTQTGVGGSLIYAFSAALRDEIARTGSAVIHLDLAPGRDLGRLVAELSKPRGSRSMAKHLRARAGIDGVKAVLLREVAQDDFADSTQLATVIKALPLQLIATRPMDEAISTAGGVKFETMDENLMLRAMPGVFCAGEMLDWEAPTGGYLLTACFASGRAAGVGVINWLAMCKS
jgi:hypothetical protein